ncbi:Protein HPO-30, partial [Aphelenchoides avenae]
AVHEHGVFYDCVHSDVTPLDEVDDAEGLTRITKQCLHKSDSAASRSLHKAVEQEGDPAAREMLLHRSLPQHKAVIFFFIFMTIFSGIAMIVGACSPCFVPISILHVISVTLAMSCSIFGATIFWLASMRPDNRYLAGVANVYQVGSAVA